VTTIEGVIDIKKLEEVRKGLGIGLREFAREAKVSVSTLQDTESGRRPRTATASKYWQALKKRGVDPNQVQELREVLGEVLFFVKPDPYSTMRNHMLRSLRENAVGLVLNGDEAAVRNLVDEVIAEHAEEGRKLRERIEAEQWQEFNEQLDQGQEGGRAM